MRIFAQIRSFAGFGARVVESVGGGWRDGSFEEGKWGRNWNLASIAVSWKKPNPWFARMQSVKEQSAKC